MTLCTTSPGDERAEYEQWLRSQHKARFWNTSDAMFAAWQAGRASSSTVQQVGAEQNWRWTYHLDEDVAATLRDFIGSTEGDGEASPITLHVGDGHSGPGLYVSMTEYPDEGSVQLVASSPKSEQGDQQ